MNISTGAFVQRDSRDYTEADAETIELARFLYSIDQAIKEAMCCRGLAPESHHLLYRRIFWRVVRLLGED